VRFIVTITDLFSIKPKKPFPIIVIIVGFFFILTSGCVNTTEIKNQTVLPTTTAVPVHIVEIKPDRSIYDSWGVLYVGEGDMKISVPPQWKNTTWNGANQLYATDKYEMSETAFVFVKTGLDFGTYSFKKQIDQNYIDNETLDYLIKILLPDGTSSPECNHTWIYKGEAGGVVCPKAFSDPTYYLISGHPARKISWDTHFQTLYKESGTTIVQSRQTGYIVWRTIEDSHNEAYILIQNDGRVAYVHGQYRPTVALWEKTIVKQSMESLTDNF